MNSYGSYSKNYNAFQQTSSQREAVANLEGYIASKTAKKPTKNGSTFFFADLNDESYKKILTLKFFGEAAEYFYDKIEKDYFYVFSQGSYTFRNDSEATFNKKSDLFKRSNRREPVLGHDIKMNNSNQSVSNFVNIAQVQEKEDKSTVSTAGYVFQIGELQTGKSKFGREFKKIDVSLVDNTNSLVQVTLWEDSACNVPFKVGDLVFIKDAAVNLFRNIRSLSASSKTHITSIDKVPDNTTIKELKGWSMHNYTGSHGRHSPNKVTIGTRNTEHQQIRDNGKYKVRARITHSEEQWWYTRCSECKAMEYFLEDSGANLPYRCLKCNRAFKSPYLYALKVTLVDVDDNQVIKAILFNDVAEELLGVNATTLNEMDEDKVALVFQEAFNITYGFVIEVKAKDAIVIEITGGSKKLKI